MSKIKGKRDSPRGLKKKEAVRGLISAPNFAQYP